LERRKLARAAARLNAASKHNAILPPLILMTDDDRLPDPPASVRALPKGSLVIVRAREAARRVQLLDAIHAIGDRIVLVADDPELAAQADGLHLPARRAHEAAHWRTHFPRWLITAAAHGAKMPDADAVLLSPIFPTASHPGGQTLSAVRANIIAAQSRVPVYALGGITARNAGLLHGFTGIAAIGALAV
jgi:thiamine-phosphate pyrophosphorylase